ncbi:hypothetical protein [Flavobacterium ginsengiterrae]|uniref:ABC transporter permease n=1 Tax=Flavobacterium ginsengiterrae TaxID=871695 RepID=A0ABP7GW84_9FLAO
MIFLTEVKCIGTFIKKNLSVLIIIPAFIGGAWQAFELMNISVPYIRFFSISQIVPDGLVILMSILASVVPMIISMILGYNVGKNNRSIYNEDEHSENKKEIFQEFIKLNKIIFLLTILLGLSWVISLKYFDNINGDLGKFYLYIIFAVVILSSSFSSMDLLYDSNKVETVKDLPTIKFLFASISLLITLNIFREVHNNFLITKNFVNVEKLDRRISEKFPKSKCEFLYFNDKYLFYKITSTKNINRTVKENEEKIYILELSEIFKEEEKKKL